MLGAPTGVMNHNKSPLSLGKGGFCFRLVYAETLAVTLESEQQPDAPAAVYVHVAEFVSISAPFTIQGDVEVLGLAEDARA